MNQQKNNHDSNHEVRKPNYTLRRIKTMLAIIGFVSSMTMLFTWRTADSQAATVLVSVIYLLTGLWLIVRFAPRD
jgi:ABC-type siderophore export system fused ATPase/permease subunit